MVIALMQARVSSCAVVETERSCHRGGDRATNEAEKGLKSGVHWLLVVLPRMVVCRVCKCLWIPSGYCDSIGGRLGSRGEGGTVFMRDGGAATTVQQWALMAAKATGEEETGSYYSNSGGERK